MAQIWADQCANVIYFHNSDMYPRIFHERGFERTTSRFHSPPGVGQNVAWALTKHVNFTRIIDDLWYRDINKLKPGRIGDFQVRIIEQRDFLLQVIFFRCPFQDLLLLANLSTSFLWAGQLKYNRPLNYFVIKNVLSNQKINDSSSVI